MKYLSHFIIGLLALLVLTGFGGFDGPCSETCLGRQEHDYLVLRCEGNPPGKLQAYLVSAEDTFDAQFSHLGGGTPIPNPLNGKKCSESTDGKGRPFTVGDSVVYAQIPGEGVSPSTRHPQSGGTSTTTQPSAPLTLPPTLANKFPFLAPLPSNPVLAPADAPRFPSTCTSAVRSYLVNHQEGTVTAFGVCPLTVLKEITVASRPLQARVTPDGSTLLVTSYDEALVFIDTATNTVKTTLSLPNYNPQGIAISPDGTRAYLTHYFDIQPVLMVVDIPNKKLLSTIALPQAYPRVVVLTPDGSQAWVNYLGKGVITVIDLLTGTIARNINISQIVDHGIAFNPTGTKAYAAVYPDQIYVIDTATLAVRKRLTVGQSPNDLVSTPDGARIFVTSDIVPGFWWIDPTVDTVIGTWNPPGVTGGSMGLLVYR